MNSNFPVIRGLSSFLFCVLLLLAGCGRSQPPQGVKISGAVTVEGKLLEQGKITFRPVGSTTGPIVIASINGGYYNIVPRQNLSSGEFRVHIETLFKDPVLQMPGNLTPEKVAEELAKSPLPKRMIAPEYNTNTILKVHITGNEDIRYDFDVECKK